MAKPKSRDKTDLETKGAASPKRLRNRARVAKPASGERKRRVADSRPMSAAASLAPASFAPAPIALPVNDNELQAAKPVAMRAIEWSGLLAPSLEAPEPPLWQELWRPIERRFKRSRDRRLRQFDSLKRQLRARRRELAVAARRKARRARVGGQFILRAARYEVRLRLERFARVIASAARLLFVAVGRFVAHRIDRSLRAIKRALDPVVHKLTSLQRGAVAIGLAALAVALVSTAWVAVYSQAPVAVRPQIAAPSLAPIPPKQFTERVAAPAFPKIEAPSAAKNVAPIYVTPLNYAPVPNAPVADAPKAQAPTADKTEAAPTPAATPPKKAAPLPPANADKAASVPVKPKVKKHRRKRAATLRGKEPRERPIGFD